MLMFKTLKFSDTQTQRRAPKQKYLIQVHKYMKGEDYV